MKIGKHNTPHTGGEGEVEHGSPSGGVGGHTPNQVVPAREQVNRVPSDDSDYDENFRNGC